MIKRCRKKIVDKSLKNEPSMSDVDVFLQLKPKESENDKIWNIYLMLPLEFCLDQSRTIAMSK